MTECSDHLKTIEFNLKEHSKDVNRPDSKIIGIEFLSENVVEAIVHNDSFDKRNKLVLTSACELTAVLSIC